MPLLLAVPKVYVEKQLRECLKLALQYRIVVFARRTAFQVFQSSVRRGVGTVDLILHEAEYPPKRHIAKGGVNCMNAQFRVVQDRDKHVMARKKLHLPSTLIERNVKLGRSTGVSH